MRTYLYGYLILSLLGMMLLMAPTTLLYSNAQKNTTNSATKQFDKEQNSLDAQRGISTSGVTGGAAQGIFQDKELTLGKNIKNVVILIPNEGHESPALPKEQRQINQPYVPENIVVNPGTNIVWLNGDVGHQRTITMNDGNSE